MSIESTEVVQRVAKSLYVNFFPGRELPPNRFGEDTSDADAMYCLDAAKAAWVKWVAEYGGFR